MERSPSHEFGAPPDVWASFVPRSVVQSIVDGNDRMEPHVDCVDAAILFTDISGFTKLSERLGEKGTQGIELLTKHLNSYFGSLIDVIDYYGGDVIKIAGDALLAVWFIDESTTDSSIPGAIEPPVTQRKSKYLHASLAEATFLAAKCSMKCLEINKSYKIESTQGKTEQEGQLKLHCALASDVCYVVRCGGVRNKFEYLVCGDEIYGQLREALGRSVAGEVMLANSAWQALNPILQTNPHLFETQVIDDGAMVKLLAIKGTWNGLGGMQRSSSSSLSTPTKNNLKDWLQTMNIQNVHIDNLKVYMQIPVVRRLDAGHSMESAELRRCSVIFISLVGLEFGSIDSLDRIQSSLAVIQQNVYKMDGFIRQFIMDDKGCVAIVAFGIAGMAHEDDQFRAVETALKIQADLAKINMTCSMGCTTGRVFCGDVGSDSRREYAMVGDTVNFAAHLMCKKLGILCDQNTYDATHDAFFYEDIDPVTVKGKTKPVKVYRPRLLENVSNRSGSVSAPSGSSVLGRHSSIGGASPGQGRSLSVTSASVGARRASGINRNRVGIVYGRDAESNQYQSLVQSMTCKHSSSRKGCKKGDCGSKVWMIKGDAGIGKTALGLHFVTMGMLYRVDVNFANAYSIETGSAFFVWRKIFEQLLGLEQVSDPISRTKIVEEALASKDSFMYGNSENTDVEAQERERHRRLVLLPLLSEILDFPCDESSVRDLNSKTRSDSIRMLLLHIMNLTSVRKPRVIILDDVHWMDSMSWQLLVDIVMNTPHILLITTCRQLSVAEGPAEYGQIASLEGVYSEVQLHPLNHDACFRLACEILFVEDIASIVKDAIIEKTQGNPFFIEEICYSLQQQQLIDIANGKCFLARGVELEKISFPTTVEAMVTQRIDQLDPQAASILKIGSVFGRKFRYEDIQEISSNQAGVRNLRKSLESCEKHQLVQKCGTEEQEFTFRMAITQEVAYNLLLFGQRKQLHSNIAHLLESKMEHDAMHQFATLANHYIHAEEYEKALEYLSLAADHAMLSNCTQEVVKHIREILQLVDVGKVEISQSRRAVYEQMMACAYMGASNSTESTHFFLTSLVHSGLSVPRGKGKMISGLVKTLVVQIRNRAFTEKYVASDRMTSSNSSASVSSVAKKAAKAKQNTGADRYGEIPNPNPKAFSAPADSKSKRSHESGSSNKGKSYPPGWLWHWSDTTRKDDELLLLAAMSYEHLIVLSYFQGDKLGLIYYNLRCLELAEMLPPNPFRVRGYANAALVCATVKLKSAALLYGKLALDIALKPDASAEIQTTLPAAYRSICMSHGVMGNFELGLEYSLKGLDSVSSSTDLRTYEEILVNVSHFCFLLGRVEDNQKYAQALYYSGSSRGNLQSKAWGACQLTLLCLRYGIGKHSQVLQMLEDSLYSYRSLGEIAARLDIIVSSVMQACMRCDFELVKQYIPMLCSFPPTSLFVISYDIGCLNILLRLLLVNKKMAKSASIIHSQSFLDLENQLQSEPSGVVRSPSSMEQSVADIPASASQYSVPLQSSGITGGDEAVLRKLLKSVFKHLKANSKVYPSGRPPLLRYWGYFAEEAGNKAKCRAYLEKAYHTATKYGMKYEMLAASFELGRRFPNYPYSKEK
eukprot:TRINITY_DN4136_c0_g2_i3.p1 TRINITY_DN4136_c0_g2~~TRINITY_DN4136_c0_g2_i3.p1  ORF type:complete len:1613 (-),score=302.42 TRINITY_DN4136_c0_g2_i3:724-5562(-)